MNAAILIPARFDSTRFPGKPLVPLRGASGLSRPLIQRTFEAASKVPGIASVRVVTDDPRIADACRGFGTEPVMTSADCRNGSERCAEALGVLGPVDLVINFQGDALLTPPRFIEALVERMAADAGTQVATPAIRLGRREVQALQAAEARGTVGGTSVVTDEAGNALYFSKRLIPHLPPGSLDSDRGSPIRLHVGVYAYRPDALARYARLAETELERLEGLEQLRFLGSGIPVAVVEVERPPFELRELNNPEDVPVIEQALAEQGID